MKPTLFLEIVWRPTLIGFECSVFLGQCPFLGASSCMLVLTSPSTHAFETGMKLDFNVNSIEESRSFVNVIMVWDLGEM